MRKLKSRQLFKFFFTNLGLSKLRIFAFMVLSIIGVFAEAFGLGMIIPILDFIRADGDVQALIDDNIAWLKFEELMGYIGLETSLLLLLSVFIGCIAFRQVFDYFYSLSMIFLKNDLMHDLRLLVFNHSQSINFKNFQLRMAGEYINMLDYQTEEAASILPNFIRIFRILVTFLLYAGALLLTSPTFILAGILQFALILLPMMTYIGKTRRASLEIIRQRGLITDYFSESYLAARVVRLFSLEAMQLEALRDVSWSYKSAMISLTKISLQTPLLLGLLIALAISTQVFFGYKYLGVSAVTLTVFILILLRLAPAALSLMSYSQNIAKQLVSLDSLMKELDKTPATCLPTKNKLASISRVNKISLKNVEFSHADNEKTVLKNFSATFHSGELTVIRGVSGCGKSTLLDLISGLISPQSGEILYDSRDISSVDSDQLRKMISYSSQEAFIFKGSILENICLGKKFNPDLFESAVSIGHLGDVVSKSGELIKRRDFISRTSLSGGQKQRVSIGRCIYKEGSVLLLDEPTSAIDSKLEKSLMRGIRAYTKEKDVITILVSHNPAHYEFADKEIILDSHPSRRNVESV